MDYWPTTDFCWNSSFPINHTTHKKQITSGIQCPYCIGMELGWVKDDNFNIWVSYLSVSYYQIKLSLFCNRQLLPNKMASIGSSTSNRFQYYGSIMTLHLISEWEFSQAKVNENCSTVQMIMNFHSSLT